MFRVLTAWRSGLLVSLLALGFGLSLQAAAAAADDTPPKWEPTSHYATRQVEGWTVLVNKRLLETQPELSGKVLELLRFQLFQVVRRLPPKVVEKLRQVKIWVEETEANHPGLVYHPNPDWLRDHGINPEKARCVEIANARNFLSWSFDQPWMVLHELAHAYHDQFLPSGFGNPEIRQAYTAAQKAGQYEKVLRSSGREEKAYAVTNPQEYFAEASEAFFGTNDFYPFVRAELKRHDPELESLLIRLWEIEPRKSR